MQGPQTENEEGAQNRAEGAGVPLGAEYNTKQTRAEFLERRSWFMRESEILIV
jgi:hypothetical protein